MPEYVVADTTVISHLTKVSPHSRSYEAMLGERRVAISFQTIPELRGAGFGQARRTRVEALLSATLQLPHAASTNEWYAQVVARRKDLRKKGFAGADASDADVWIISSALEHGLPLFSHDRQQVLLGRAMGMRVWTNLNDLRGDNPTS